MRLGESILREFSGGRSPDQEVTNQADALRVLLVEQGGSVSGLARFLDRPRRTVRGWLTGTTPRGGARWIVHAAVVTQRRSWLDAEEEDRLRNGFDVVTVGGTLSISDDEARVLELEFLPGYGDQLVDAYLDGATAEEMETIFINGIADDWYRDAVADHWDTNWLDPWG
jgi:hypothetical protein